MKACFAGITPAREFKDEEFVGAVAVLDLMGFVHRAEKMTPREALDELVTPLMHAAKLAKLQVNLDLDRLDSRPAVQWHQYADTVLLYLPLSPEGPLSSPAQVIESMAYACSLFVAKSVCLGIPVRGAIAYGQYLVHQNPRILLGKPFLEAHKLEGEQQWAGVALCQSAIVQAGDVTAHRWLRKWNVEICEKTTQEITEKELLVVNWPVDSLGPYTVTIHAGGSSSAGPGPLPDWAKCFPGDTDKIKRLRENTARFYNSAKQHPSFTGGPE
ncbi:MAG: hypothetical protein ABSC19_04185 [Syntrophorhabdales bacterium]